MKVGPSDAVADDVTEQTPHADNAMVAEDGPASTRGLRLRSKGSGRQHGGGCAGGAGFRTHQGGAVATDRRRVRAVRANTRRPCYTVEGVDHSLYETRLRCRME